MKDRERSKKLIFEKIPEKSKVNFSDIADRPERYEEIWNLEQTFLFTNHMKIQTLALKTRHQITESLRQSLNNIIIIIIGDHL